jgi:hypothetical protein
MEQYTNGCSSRDLILTHVREPKNVSQWKGNFRIMINKAAVKIGKAQERLDILDRTRFRPISDRVEFLGIHFDTVGANNITEVSNLGLVELAFLRVSEEPCFLKPVEHFLDMLVMFFLGTRENQNIIKIDNTENIKIIAQRVHDKSLKG